MVFAHPTVRVLAGILLIRPPAVTALSGRQLVLGIPLLAPVPVFGGFFTLVNTWKGPRR